MISGRESRPGMRRDTPIGSRPATVARLLGDEQTTAVKGYRG